MIPHLPIVLMFIAVARSFRTTGIKYHPLQQASRLLSTPSSVDGFSGNRPSFAEVATRLWVERVVFNQGLCPWAGSVLPKGYMKVTTTVMNVDNDASLLQLCDAILSEATSLAQSDNKKDGASTSSSDEQPITHKTTLVVVPNYRAFDDFLQLVDILETLLESEGIDQHIQLAHFHPQYQFENSSVDDVENYTNRSPFPVIHLLRTDDVAKGIAEYGDTSVIWERNQATLRSLGIEKIKEMNAQILRDAEKRCL